MKKLIILFIAFTILFATNNPNENKTKTDNRSSTLSKIIAIPLYPVIFIGGLATILFEGTAIVISYPIRTLIKEKKDKR